VIFYSRFLRLPINRHSSRARPKESPRSSYCARNRLYLTSTTLQPIHSSMRKTRIMIALLVKRAAIPHRGMSATLDATGAEGIATFRSGLDPSPHGAIAARRVRMLPTI
jgi:hypothetical protein